MLPQQVALRGSGLPSPGCTPGACASPALAPMPARGRGVTRRGVRGGAERTRCWGSRQKLEPL
eukprot:1923629-Lingulodinium_polyedra.AAC.1